MRNQRAASRPPTGTVSWEMGSKWRLAYRSAGSSIIGGDRDEFLRRSRPGVVLHPASITDFWRAALRPGGAHRSNRCPDPKGFGLRSGAKPPHALLKGRRGVLPDRPESVFGSKLLHASSPITNGCTITCVW